MKTALQIFSFLGAFLGLLILFYLPFVFWFIALGCFFIAWGILSFFFLNEALKYKLALKIFSYLGGALGAIIILFTLWGLLVVGASLIMRNFLILSLVLGLFMLAWSLVVFKCFYLNKQNVNKKK